MTDTEPLTKDLLDYITEKHFSVDGWYMVGQFEWPRTSSLLSQQIERRHE